MIGGTRFIDLQRLGEDAEKLGRCVATLVEPVEGLIILPPKSGSDPDSDGRIMASDILDHLAEMIVIGRLNLVLFNDLSILTQAI
jgi:hypothetical protein